MTMSVQVKDIQDGAHGMAKTPISGANVVLLVPKSRSPGIIRQGSMPQKAVLRGSKLSCSPACTNAILSNVAAVPNGPIPTTNNSSASSTSSGAEGFPGDSIASGSKGGTGGGTGGSSWLTTSSRPLQSSLKKSSHLEPSGGGGSGVNGPASARSVHFDKRRPQTLELDLSTSPASSSASIAAVTGRSSTVSVHFNETLSYSQSYDESDQANEPCFSLAQNEHMELGELISSDEEKKLKRASCVIGVIATLIFLLCFAMVAVTLHLSPEIDKLATEKLATVQRQFNASFSTTSTLDFDLDPGENQDTIYANEEVLKGESIQDLESSSISHEDKSNLLNSSGLSRRSVGSWAREPIPWSFVFSGVATSQKPRSFKAGKVDVIGSDKVKFNNFERLLWPDDESISMS